MAEDYTALAQLSGGEAVGGEGVVRAIHREESVTMLLDGRHMSAALAAMPRRWPPSSISSTASCAASTTRVWLGCAEAWRPC